MRSEEIYAVTEVDWTNEKIRTKRLERVLMLIAGVAVPVLSLPALLLTTITAEGNIRYLVIVGWSSLLFLPVSYLMFSLNIRQRVKSDRLVGTLTDRLSAAVSIASEQVERPASEVRRREFETRLANAMEMANGEVGVIDVIERSFTATLPDTPVELFLADSSRTHLRRIASSSPTEVRPSCGVEWPDRCPALRRAQIQRFSSSEELDACPNLRATGAGPISALCVPVAIMGRTAGVIHATGKAHASVGDDAVQDLRTLAKLAGARLGLLQVMAEAKLQAATDSLTGLLNRRSFGEQTSDLRRREPALSLAIADIDNFKILNDTNGHEVGDRALRLFAQVLRESVRADDVVSRHGGDEFVIAFPGCTAESVRAILELVRVKLGAAIIFTGLPQFTISFGVVDAKRHEDLPLLIARADAALFEAKRGGRDRVCIHDGSGKVVSAAQSRQGTSSKLGRERMLSAG